MNKLTLYIKDFIRENAKKDFTSGYDLHTTCDLDKDLQEELVSTLFVLDRDTIKELILDHAQGLIDEHLPIVESEDGYALGLTRQIDRINGESYWGR